MTARVASVRVDTGPVDQWLKLRDVPRSLWRELMLARSDFIKVNFNADCRKLVEFVADAEIMYEALGFDSAEQMVRDGYELDPADVEIAVAWLKKHAPEQAIGTNEN